MNGRGFHKERLFFRSLALRKRKKKREKLPTTPESLP